MLSDEKSDNPLASSWLDTKQAAKYLALSPKTLALWRSQGKGPRYKIAGQRLVRYHISDLDAWVKGEAKQ
jgi:excisionase family DNA binding protein